MKLDLKPIMAARDGVLPFSYDADMTEEEMYGEHPFRTPVHIEGEVRNHLDIMRLTAEVSAKYETSCARCLEPVTVQLNVPCEMVLTREVQNEDEDDIYLLEGDSVEIDDIAIPELLLDVQMTYLCRPDCKGICPSCGRNLNEGPCGCSGKQIDSRLAVLQKLLDGDEKPDQ